MRKDVRADLEKLDFGELRKLIDDCLSSDFSLRTKHLTFERNQISQYINILQSKVPRPPRQKSQPSPPPEPPKSRIQSIAEEVKNELISRVEREGRMPADLIEAEKHAPLSFTCKKSQKKTTLRVHVSIFSGSATHSRGIPFDNAILREHEQYRVELKKHADKLKAFHKTFRPRPQVLSTKQSIVNRLKQTLESGALKVTGVKQLYWQILPRGEDPFKRIRGYLQQSTARRESVIDYDKIRAILALRPNEIYSGIDKFDGYLVFYFERKKKAVLDCPWTGNAIYIFGQNWQEQSKLSKSELLNLSSQNTIRIIHRGEWRQRLKERLGL